MPTFFAEAPVEKRARHYTKTPIIITHSFPGLSRDKTVCADVAILPARNAYRDFCMDEREEFVYLMAYKDT